MCNVRNKKWHVYETRGFLKLRSGKELCYFKSLNGKKEFGSNTCLKGQCQGMGAWVRISVNFDFRPPWTEIKICQKYCKSSQITAIFPWDIKFTAWGRRRDIFLLAARVIFAKDTLEWVFWRFADEELWWFRPRSSRPWDFDLEINSQLLLVLFFFRFSLGNSSRTPDYVD